MSPVKPNRNVTFQVRIRCTRKGGALGRRLGDEQEGTRLVPSVRASKKERDNTKTGGADNGRQLSTMSKEEQAVRPRRGERVGASRARTRIQSSQGWGRKKRDHRSIPRALWRFRTNPGGREAGQRGARGGPRDTSTVADKRKAVEEAAEAIAAQIVAGGGGTIWRGGKKRGGAPPRVLKGRRSLAP